MFCELCNGILEHLGKLGKLTWFRCRNCGADCGVEDFEPHELDNED